MGPVRRLWLFKLSSSHLLLCKSEVSPPGRIYRCAAPRVAAYSEPMCVRRGDRIGIMRSTKARSHMRYLLRATTVPALPIASACYVTSGSDNQPASFVDLALDQSACVCQLLNWWSSKFDPSTLIAEISDPLQNKIFCIWLVTQSQ
jgi:hypothetical protein